ncbi:MAG: hypothetical protein K2X93_10055 [Candidatus Obscuribacterales bacterium]|nr:hypothetical protein [Candidatus Obscuribacterales bacterium]
MVKTVLIYIQNSESSGFTRPAADKKSGMNACNSFENLSILELPFLVWRKPRTASKWLTDKAVTMEQFEKLRDTCLPPLREVILSRKSSRRARNGSAHRKLSGNGIHPPKLIRDELT